MTLADLRALHAIIGTALDDIDRVYRPATAASTAAARRPSHSSHTNSNSSRSHSHYSSTDSELDADADTDDADVFAPPTPVSPGVRFASSKQTGSERKRRERAQTLPPLPHPNIGNLGCSPGSALVGLGMRPPPILKQPPLDFPSLDAPILTASPSGAGTGGPVRLGPDTTGIGETPMHVEWKKKCEDLTAHPDVIAAVNRIVAASGQLAASVQKPFLTLCDAAMGYHLPACLRFLEASHTVEILREAGPRGMHVEEIAKRISSSTETEETDDQGKPASKGLDPNKLSHVLRLLATHHITREVRPNVFANNRISSVIDTGKPWRDLVGSEAPEKKYEETDGFAAFVGLCTDEIFKAAAYLTDCYLLPDSDREPELPASMAQQIVVPPYPSSHPSELPSPPQSASSSSPPLSPPLPPWTRSGTGSGNDSAEQAYGMYTPNDSTVSLPNISPTSSPKISHTQNASVSASGSPQQMTFAQNPSPGTYRSKRGSHGSHDEPATPRSAPRVRGLSMSMSMNFRRLSSRSTTPTPAPPVPVPATPTIPVPATPRGQKSHDYGLQTPRSAATTVNADTLRTPSSRDSGSTPSRDSVSSVASSVSTSTGGSDARVKSVKKKASFGSFGSFGFGGSRKKGSPPTPRSPVVRTSRSRQGSAHGSIDMDSNAFDGQDQGHQHHHEHEQDRERGLLGPAFDLRPPALVAFPRARTFPGAAYGDEEVPPPVPPKPYAISPPQTYATSPPKPYAIIGPPPLPPKSALRQMSSPVLGRGVGAGGVAMTRVVASSPSNLRVSPPESGLALKSALKNGERMQMQKGWKGKGRENQTHKERERERGGAREGERTAGGMSRDNEMYAPFNVAFGTRARYFEWLERGENAFRLRRFGKAMTGTSGWESPGSVIKGFPWQELPPRSVVVDVGGGIGSTSMLLANAFPALRFVIQDRPPVVEMGTTAWRGRNPEILDTGRVVFQAHDFFKPQPSYPDELDVEKADAEPVSPVEEVQTKTAVVPAVYLLRVITHDWPDSYVTRILLRLRQSAGPGTRLLLADYVLPLACVDEDEDVEPETPNGSEDFDQKLTREPLPGTVRTLAPEGSPLLPSLGKASANAYWLDLTMRVMFNSQERTLRELASLTLGAGWKITQVTRAEGSLFGHIIAVPVDIPPETLALPMNLDGETEADTDSTAHGDRADTQEEMQSPPMGETFLTNTYLPSEDAIKAGVAHGLGKAVAKVGVGVMKKRERANTFTASRATPGPGPAKGVEVKRGWRSIVKMLSKPQMRGGGGSSSGRDEAPPAKDWNEYTLTRQSSRGK